MLSDTKHYLMRIKIGSIVIRRMLSVATVITISSLVGCASLGPKEIHYGRTNYNNAIQRSTNDQFFMNIIRAKNAEPTLFIDVTEVDAAASFQAQLSGSTTGIGASRGTSGGTLAGTVGQIGTMFQYLEQPNIRYQPLQGQPLVQQLVRPVDVDSLWFLSDSNWPLSSILSFTLNYISPNYEDHFSALNAILQLDEWGALAIAAVKSDLTQSSLNDALVLYLEPDHVAAKNESELEQRRKEVLDLWVRLLRLYIEIPQPSVKKTSIAADCDKATETRETLAKNNYLSDLQKLVALMSPEEVKRHFQCLPKWIEIRTAPIKATSMPERTNIAPVMRTRSALGILKASVEEWEGSQIEFLPFKNYEKIRKRQLKGADFYILLRGERKYDRDLNNTRKSDQDQCTEARSEVEATIQMLFSNIRDNYSMLKSAEKLCLEDHLLDKCGHEFMDMCVTLKIQKDISSDIVSYTYFGVYSPMDVNNFTHVKMENRLAHLRRFILIIEDDSSPEQKGVNPFVSYQAVDDHDGHNTWYYIDNDDRISKNNFALLLEFFTMMAIPSQTSPLQPSISVSPPR